MASDGNMEGYCSGNDGRRVSRLSIKNTDGAGAEAEADEDNRYKHMPAGISSLPGTPERSLPRRTDCDKEYESDAEVRRPRNRTKGRRRRLDRAWEMRQSKESDGECQVLVRSPGRDWSMRMDVEEMKACRDLGIELPSDWTVEIPYAHTSSGGNSPMNSWRISSPGDDPKDVKARLRTWAQAVAFASASRLGV